MISRLQARLSGAFILLIVIILTGTPLLMKYYATQWLQENGGEQVAFKDIDFNPFKGALVLEGLDVKVGSQTTLAFDQVALHFNWLPLFEHKISLKLIELNGFNIIIDQRPANMRLIGGIRIPKTPTQETRNNEPAEAPDWLAGIETLRLNHVNVTYMDTDVELNIELDKLQLEHLRQWTRDGAAHLRVNGKLNQAPFSLDAKLAPLAATPDYRGKLKIEALSLEGFGKLVESSVSQLKGSFSYHGDFAWTQNTDGFRLEHDGEVRLQELDTRLANPPLRLVNRSASLKGSLTLLDKDQQPQLDLDGDLSLEGLRLIIDKNSLELLSAGKLELNGIDVKASRQLAINVIRIDDMGMGRSAEQKSNDAFLGAKQFEVNKLKFSDKLLTIDKVHYRDGHSRVRRNAEGKWRIIGIVDTMRALNAKNQTLDDAKSESRPDKEETLEIAINRIDVSGDSRISLRDESVKPVFETELKIDTLYIDKLDTRKPEQKSNFELDAGIGKHTRLNFKGNIQPFAQPFSIDLKSSINALGLPQLSPYTRKSLGLALNSGSLNADTTLQINREEMQGLLKLELHQLTLETVESENSLQSSIPIPINVALDTLRDRNDTISLKIPIKGDPNNPGFDTRDAMTKALAVAVEKGTLTYLMLALQPYGALITAAKYAEGELNRLQLKPVEFAPGSTDIDAANIDYLGKVAQVLKDRPKVAIKVCGVAVTADLQKLRAGDKSKPADPQAVASDEEKQQLTQLAKSRAEKVRDHLVENFSIPASHLVDCKPAIEVVESDAQARTDLLI